MGVILYYFNTFSDFLGTQKFIFVRHCAYNFVIFSIENMLSYSEIGIKTLPLGLGRNALIGSGDGSQLGGPANLENFWRVTSYMNRITKLILSAYLPLDGNFISGIRLFKSWSLTRMYNVPLVTDLRLSNKLVYGKQRSKYDNGIVVGTLGSPKG